MVSAAVASVGRVVGGGVRRLGRGARRLVAPSFLARVALLGVVLAFPILPFVPFSVVGSANLGASYALVAIALVMLTGWVGQISLGHAAFVGVGAYATGWASSALNIPFPVSAPVAGIAGGAVALVLGAVALRVRGLYLAVATLIFSWMADSFLFRQDWITDYSTLPSRHVGNPGDLPSFDLTNRRTIYYLVWVLVALGLVVAANVRDSKSGRAFFAIRGSEVAAASLGIDVTRYKLLAFGVSGFLAGVAGSIIMGDARVVSPDQFSFNASLFYLAIAVVGGIRSLPGAIVSALVFASLNEVFFRVEALGGYLEVVSASLLVVVLLVHRGGLAALATEGATSLRHLVFGRRRAAGAGEAPLELVSLPVSLVASINGPESPPKQPARVGKKKRAPEPERPAREESPAIMQTQSVTVQFGGLTAVSDVSLSVREGEIVGLIGPNGAGKTVTFNSIAGLVVPTSGRVFLFGQDVTNAAVHERARMGVARTFQAIQLFPQLTVFENLLVATHVHNPTGFVSHLLVTERSVAQEQRHRQRVREVMARMGLEAVADRHVIDLPFGVLRMVEVARALVTDFRFIMLDEPASGLDNRETDALVAVLRGLHADGITLLLIEHDVKMVTSVCDFIYVLDRGQLIAEGTAETIARNPHVIEAYIGRALEEEPVA